MLILIKNHTSFSISEEDLLPITKELLSFDEMTELCNKDPNFDFTDKEITIVTKNGPVTYNTRVFNYRLNIFQSFCKRGSRNFRGTLFNKDTKELIALPFFKFFNYEENPFTSKELVEKFEMQNVFEKVDGSLIYFYMLGDSLFCRTKRSIDNDQIRLANSIVERNPNLKDWIIDMIQDAYTPMFELLSPRNTIVVKYKFEDLCFIAKRCMRTGEVAYSTDPNLDVPFWPKAELGFSMPLALYPILDTFSKFEDVVDNCNTEEFERENLTEGYVVSFTNGELVKIKRKQYIDFARLKEDALNDTSIVKLLFSDSLDDLFREFKEDQDILDFIEKITNSVNDTWNVWHTEMKKFWVENKDLETKEFALKAKDFCIDKPGILFSIAMEYFKSKGNSDFSRLKQSFISNRLWRNSKFYTEK